MVPKPSKMSPWFIREGLGLDLQVRGKDAGRQWSDCLVHLRGEDKKHDRLC